MEEWKDGIVDVLAVVKTENAKKPRAARRVRSHKGPSEKFDCVGGHCRTTEIKCCKRVKMIGMIKQVICDVGTAR